MNKELFEALRIGRITIPNRFVRSATWEGMCDDTGAPADRLADTYARLAAGGVGLIISGYTYVRADGKQLPGKMGIYSDRLIPALQKVTAAVHREQGLTFCQLVHAGGQTSSKVIGTTPVAPSAVACDNFPEIPRELSKEEIAELVNAFADGAVRARQAGFDGIQLHGAHGYLINQFLSPLTNHRQDEYGGGLENRMRFLDQVTRAVRAAVGPDYPVTIKLTAADNLPGGFDLDEAVQVARHLEKIGVDAIEVSSGTAASGALTPARQGIDAPAQEAYNADFARRIKAALGIPTGVVGGLRSGAVIKGLLDGNLADFFALSRPLIREPDLVNRWRRDPGYCATCISCNGCFKPGLKGEGIYCVLDRPPR
ncbi:NADH:flavin oxidoreductase [Trichloromonas sp.]|uniref:NADH:flavin oxidoreductase n=1 Tax=Trichloromonas sp. TaxID=3069249 RepID=UPI003D81A993